MRHEVAAIWSGTAEGVEADPAGRPAQVGDRGRGSREELEIDGDVYPETPEPAQRGDGSRDGGQRAVCIDGHDVARRDQRHDVEDEAVLLEHDEEDVLEDAQLNSAQDSREGDDRRPLSNE